MAIPSLSRPKPKDYRPALLTLARMYAKEEAKRRIRAQGHKLSAYWPKDITLMSMAILEAEPEPFITQARETIARWIAQDQRKTVHTLMQSVNSPSETCAQDKEITL